MMGGVVGVWLRLGRVTAPLVIESPRVTIAPASDPTATPDRKRFCPVVVPPGMVREAVTFPAAITLSWYAKAATVVTGVRRGK